MKKALFFPVISLCAIALLTPSLAAAQDDEETAGDEASAAEEETAAPKSEAAGEASTTAPPAADDAAASMVSGQSVEMRELEERVNDLKERIFRSKARLMLLRETVLNGAIAGAKAKIIHRNEMGSSFVLEKATYALDGAPIFSKVNDDDDSLADAEEIELFTGSIVPGNHNISVQLVFRGNGFGVFSYLKGYKFTIKSSYAFTAEEGKATTIRVVPYEKGGLTTDLRERPAVRYDVEVKQEKLVAPTSEAKSNDEGKGQ